MWLTSSSIGRKFVMALTGAALVLFVTFHCLMNTVAIIWPAAYNEICMFLGANWYALIASMGLALLFIIHIIYALWLTIQNRAARGENRYAVNTLPPHVEWSSKNMLVLGIVVLAFLGVHLWQFWAKMQLQEVMGSVYVDKDGVAQAPEFGTLFLQQAFSNCWAPILYIIGFVALWFHMTHGFWSMFHTVGWDNNRWIERLKKIGNAWTTIVVLLFVAQVVVFTGYAYAGKTAQNILNEAQDQVDKGQANVEDLVKAQASAAKWQKWGKFIYDPACRAQYGEYWTEQAEKLNESLINEAQELTIGVNPYDENAIKAAQMPLTVKYIPKYEYIFGAIKAQCPNTENQTLMTAQRYYSVLQEIKQQQ